MSEIKLLPCPFCGGEATKVISPKGDERWVMFKCPTFGCIQQQGFCRDEKEAIRLWNTRKPMEEIIERLEVEEDKCFDDFAITKDYYYDGKGDGIERAIVIVKEVGGIE